MQSQTTKTTTSQREIARLPDLIATLDKVRALARLDDVGRIERWPWTVGWHPAHDHKVCVVATYPAAIKLIDRIELTAKLVTAGYKVIRWNDGKHGTDLIFFLPGPLHVVEGQDCAGELTLEIRETTSIRTNRELQRALSESNEQWSAA